MEAVLLVVISLKHSPVLSDHPSLSTVGKLRGTSLRTASFPSACVAELRLGAVKVFLY